MNGPAAEEKAITAPRTTIYWARSLSHHNQHPYVDTREVADLPLVEEIPNADGSKDHYTGRPHALYRATGDQNCCVTG